MLFRSRPGSRSADGGTLVISNNWSSLFFPASFIQPMSSVETYNVLASDHDFLFVVGRCSDHCIWVTCLISSDCSLSGPLVSVLSCLSKGACIPRARDNSRWRTPHRNLCQIGGLHASHRRAHRLLGLDHLGPLECAGDGPQDARAHRHSLVKKEGYVAKMAQPAFLVLAQDGTVLYSWAIVPSLVSNTRSSDWHVISLKLHT